jgi:hypothetical protein
LGAHDPNKFDRCSLSSKHLPQSLLSERGGEFKSPYQIRRLGRYLGVFENRKIAELPWFIGF